MFVGIFWVKSTFRISDVGEWEPESGGDSSARIWCPDLLHEGQWHHLVVVLNRAVLKNSSFSLFLDGHVSENKWNDIFIKIK